MSGCWLSHGVFQTCIYVNRQDAIDGPEGKGRDQRASATVRSILRSDVVVPHDRVRKSSELATRTMQGNPRRSGSSLGCSAHAPSSFFRLKWTRVVFHVHPGKGV